MSRGFLEARVMVMLVPIWLLSLVFGLALLLAAAPIIIAYQRDIAFLRKRVAAGSRIAATAAGPIEYADVGDGRAVLVVHGASGGYDQGLLIANANLEAGARTIALSRFGYLRTPFPPDASPAAQADAHVALLDALAIDRVVVLGFSAGGRSAIEMALRHPQRVQGLILESLVLAAPFSLPNFNRSALGRRLIALIRPAIDFCYWLAITLAPGVMIRFAGASMKTYAKASPAERSFVKSVMRGMLPLSVRLKGLANDAENVIEPWPFEQLAVPTLIVAVADDLFRTVPTAQMIAARAPDAKLVTFAGGGHMLIGHHAEVRAAVGAFLARLAGAEA